MQMSWISSARRLLPAFWIDACRTAPRRVEGGTWARAPFLARHSGVRSALTMTTSSGDEVFETGMFRCFDLAPSAYLMGIIVMS